ncbi:MAG: hypothetical protein J6Y47_05755 [Bacteroidales bacterium]|nr:hypothetical protein [Bacteroidales bacterium]
MVTSVNFGDYYLVYEPNVKTNIVVRLDAYTGKRTDYFSHVYQNDTYKMISINPPSAYINSSGDTLLCSVIVIGIRMNPMEEYGHIVTIPPKNACNG